jgi:hypothetical protein
VVTILNDWRKGLYMFFGWLFVEYLARKYLGNNMAMFFEQAVQAAFSEPERQNPWGNSASNFVHRNISSNFSREMLPPSNNTRVPPAIGCSSTLRNGLSCVNIRSVSMAIVP